MFPRSLFSTQSDFSLRYGFFFSVCTQVIVSLGDGKAELATSSGAIYVASSAVVVC